MFMFLGIAWTCLIFMLFNIVNIFSYYVTDAASRQCILPLSRRAQKLKEEKELIIERAQNI